MERSWLTLGREMNELKETRGRKMDWKRNRKAHSAFGFAETC